MHVHQHGDGGVDGGNCLNGQHRVKETAARSAHLLGNLNAHQAQIEELLDQAISELLLVVHGANLRGDGLLGKLAHGREEEALFFGELRERSWDCMGQRGTSSGFGV